MGMSKCGIYKIESPSWKVYIGQSRNIAKRWSAHRRTPNKGQPLLYNSITKYGSQNHTFEIIHELPKDISQGDINNCEQFYMDQYRECGFRMLNLKGELVLGGHSAESRAKMSESRIGKKQSAEVILKRSQAHVGMKRSEETKSRISASLKGKKFSAERRARMCIAQKGKHNVTEEQRKKMSERMIGSKNPFFGKKHTNEIAEIIRLKNTGKVRSDEIRIRMSACQIGKHSQKRSKETIEKIRLSKIGVSPSEATRKKISAALMGNKNGSKKIK